MLVSAPQIRATKCSRILSSIKTENVEDEMGAQRPTKENTEGGSFAAAEVGHFLQYQLEKSKRLAVLTDLPQLLENAH